MKRIVSLLFIVVTSVAFMSGCSENPKKKLFPFFGAGSASSSGEEEQVFTGPSSVTATDGTYKDKVGINWTTVEKAVTYRIYRSESVGGPFTQQIGTVNASDLSNVDTNAASTGTTPTNVTTTAISGNCDEPVMQSVYQSNVDLSNGFYNHPTESENIRIRIGNSLDKNVGFGPGFLALGKRWSRDEVIAAFNSAIQGEGYCEGITVDGKQCIRIVSTKAIVLQNNNSFPDLSYPLFESPLKKILDSNAGWDTTLIADPIMIACSDKTSPTVTLVSPSSGATDIAVNSKVSVAFSEPIAPSTMTTSSFTLTAGGSPVAGSVSSSGVFTPTSELSSNTQYTATITTAVTDLAGNHLATSYVWNFTTSSSVLYYFVDKSVSGGSHYYYVVSAVDDDGNESLTSPVEEGFVKANDSVPGKVPSCSASDGQAGSVTVTWTPAAGATYYRIYRITSAGSTQVGGNISGFTYTDSTVGPGLFVYKIAPFNTYGEGISSDSDTGYRTVTDQEFFDLAYKEEASGLSRIQKLKNSGTGMLGSETVLDLNGDGKCVYNASYSLGSGLATVGITFTNFCDYFLSLNGTQTTLANTSGNGTMSGQIDVAGIYKGSIVFDLKVTGGKASGGTYTVQQEGSGTETTIPGTYAPAL